VIEKYIDSVNMTMI